MADKQNNQKKFWEDDSNRLRVIIGCAILVVLIIGAAIWWMASGSGKNGGGNETNITETNGGDSETPQPTERIVYTPTFMYFVSGSDATYDDEIKVFNELQSEYEGRVNFDLRNIDTDTEAATNFPVQGSTPMLIMLNTNNDISAMSPMTSDKDTLKQIIEAAMGN